MIEMKTMAPFVSSVTRDGKLIGTLTFEAGYKVATFVAISKLNETEILILEAITRGFNDYAAARANGTVTHGA